MTVRDRQSDDEVRCAEKRRIAIQEIPLMRLLRSGMRCDRSFLWARFSEFRTHS